jgi:hypothetical protein
MNDTTTIPLAERVRPDEDRAIDALRRGDVAAVRALLPAMARGQAGLEALTLHTLARKIGKLRQDLGEARTREVLARIGAQLMKTWVAQVRRGDRRGAIADLVAVFKHQLAGRLAPLTETDTHVVLEMAPCGSGGQLERQGQPARHPAWYGGWSDGVSGFCQGCKANQRALNDALGTEFWTTDKQPDGGCRMRFAKSAPEPLFDADARRALVQTRVQAIAERLDAGRADVEELLRGQRRDWMPWHDFVIVWLEYFYASALEIGGADYLDQMLAQTYEPAFHAGFPRYAALSNEDRVTEGARTWHYHMAEFTVTEEADRYVFRLDPCGSGGRLYRGQVWRDMFHYGEPLSPLMPAPHPINFNRADAPTYCTHCAASNRPQLRGAGDGKTPLFFVLDGHAQSAPGLPCRQILFKKGAPASAPEPALYAQVGLMPPATATDKETLA